MRYTMAFFAIAASAAFAADLPVRQVVLYKHGVGYFERGGRLGPGETARLDFKASEMDDVLKSLTIEAQGGKIAGLRYDSSEPLAQKLAGFPFQLGEGQPLGALLDQLKGVRIELRLGTETVAGTIVGARLAEGGDKQPERETVTLMVDSGDLRRFDLAAVTSIRFTDPKLQLQFKDYLAAVSGARSKEKRSIYIDSTDAQARDISAAYMIPMPVWKSSYRLLFAETGQPTLEGWAIVDNTTGEDWTNIRLSLVSGRPVSFVSKLYEPRYVARRTAELPEEQAAAPVVHEGALGMAPSAGLARGVAKEMRTYAAAPPPPPPAAKAQAAPAPDQWFRRADASTIDVAVAGREAGDLFEYRISTPVTVRKSESAMLPFLQQKVDARKLLIYIDPSSVHPMNAAEISNSTGKTLDGGPVTIYDGGVYGGEGLVETLKSGDKRLISYAVDLGTRITTAYDSKNAVVREVHLNRGIFTTRSAAVETRTYTIRNVDQKPKTLVIEHPVRPEYTLLDRKPSEKTTRAYRFEVKLAPGATEKFPVTEERVFDTTTAVANLTPDVILTYTSNKSISDAARKQLERIAAAKRDIAFTRAQQQNLQNRVTEITRDQERLRQNIDSLNRVSGQQQQVQTYARQLAAQESELASLRDQWAAAQKKVLELQAELDKLIETVEF